MPPKCKFDRETIVKTALNMVRKDGIDAITARALGERLESSSKPIFSVFNNMEEVQQEVIKAAKDVYNQYVKLGLMQDIAFKGVGVQYIRFAQNEPKLFQLLFMTEQTEKNDVFGILPLIDDNCLYNLHIHWRKVWQKNFTSIFGYILTVLLRLLRQMYVISAREK